MSLVPRIFTSVLTLISFPILLRAVGASEYGIIVYLGAVIAVLESLADFGVSSAAGKGIAEARARRPNVLAEEVARWARLQAGVAMAGALPVFGLAYLYARYAATIRVPLILLFLLVASTLLSIIANFVRACIRSCLQFKSLMVLDTIESMVRSASWVGVAWVMPTAIGIAAAGLITVLLVSAVGVATLVAIIRAKPWNLLGVVGPTTGSQEALHTREMLRQSVHFLGLRFSTRATQAIPLVVIGRTAGPGVVGVIGAFSRISELLGFPFAVIGNALCVRAQEVVLKNVTAIATLWDTVLRFGVLSVVVAGAAALGSGMLANLLLPGNAQAILYFALLSATIATSAISAMIAPMSDYIGALPKRVALLSVMAVVQVPILYLGAVIFGPIGAVAAYVLALCSATVGYTLIAKRAFFGSGTYRPAADVQVFFLLVMASLVLSVSIRYFAPVMHLSITQKAVLQSSFFMIVLALGVLATRSVRVALTRGALFDFTHPR